MTPREFAQALLVRLDLPTSANNIAALIAFEGAEGGHMHNSARYNPMNTARNMPGAQGAGLQVPGIKAYASWDDGLEATARTIEQGTTSHVPPGFDMSGIFKALARSAPPDETLRAIAASPWGWSTAAKPAASYQGYADLLFPQVGLAAHFLPAMYARSKAWHVGLVVGLSAAAGLLLYSRLKR